MFMKNLIDLYIMPLIGQSSPDFGPLLGAILKVAVFYLIGVWATFSYNRIMVYVTQGTLKNLRNDMFHHMESLPIKYFDTHAHGDIMSIYTNDIDTLRQMISQSMPQLLSSVITIVSVFVSMIILSIPLTLVSLVMIAIMLFTTKKVAGLSGRYFLAQQKSLGAVNGYIEEMMEGQKVVKVFCHEEESLEKFNQLNDELYDSANNANKYGNILGPVNAQLGNVSYVVCAIAGGIFATYGVGGLTLGALASFLTFNKSINMPINQVSQQLNSVVMALAGADRIEGTLFGNGERTGNVDIITLAMNMYAQGVDPELDFSDMPGICEKYEKFTGMNVDPRSPYSGSLVFAAFSGSHQDAIAKGMHWIEEKDPDHWTVPYLPIDPRDVGRSYDANVIRINSQSGKGGVGYILETKYGLNLPPKMREAMGYAAKAVSDHTHKELHPDEIFELFKETFENVKKPLDIQKVHFQQNGHITTQVTSSFEGRVITTEADGNGRLDAVSNALKKAYDMQYTLVSYTEHALEMSTSSKAIAYVGIQKPDGSLSWGAGVDSDIIRASIDALVTAINNR